MSRHDAHDKDVPILYALLGLPAVQIGPRCPVIYGIGYSHSGNKVTYCITPHIAMLSLTHANGGTSIHARLIPKETSLTNGGQKEGKE